MICISGWRYDRWIYQEFPELIPIIRVQRQTRVQRRAMRYRILSRSSDASEDELKGVIKDFESYFVEQMLKQVKDTFTSEDEDSTMSQYKDLYMDQAIEMVADEVVDQVGENLTQQLYEQMRRNLNITTTE